MSDLTHLDKNGALSMVNISAKEITDRVAVAQGEIQLARETVTCITANQIKKGNVLEAARLAGIMAAKKVADLIPLCHQVALAEVQIVFTITPTKIALEATARCSGKTGVEMEALTAVSVAGLTIYDMCKAIDKHMVISAIKLIKKTGGKSDFSQ